MLVQNWSDALTNSLIDVLDNIIGFIPDLVGATVLLIIGLIIAWAFEFVIEKAISIAKLDAALSKMGIERYLQRADIKLNSGKFFGRVAYWIILTIFIVGITDILGLPTLSMFIVSALEWVFANLIASVLILFVAAFIAQLLKKIVHASILGAKLYSVKFLSSAVWWAVIIFGAVAALKQLGVDTGLIESTLMSLIVAAPIAIGLAIGLAFGLGGQKQAEEILERLGDRLENR